METEHLNLWQRCLGIIRDNIAADAFKTFFEPIIPIQLKNNELLIQVPSMFIYEFLEEHYVDLLHSALYREGGEGLRLKYKVRMDNTSKSDMELEGTAHTTVLPRPNVNQEIKKYDTPFETRKYLSNLDPQLNPNYTFDNFLEGRSNALARTAGKAVAENPGKTAFNPLFIYGPSGVGKTHLMNAIGVQAKRKDPRTRVLYLSAQLFKVQYTDSIRQNRFNDFMNFYQTIDLLIMDDIQELSGVTATQNTFFHIFNHLQQNGKQIILSADKPPIQIQGLEDRLLTRFKWGLTAEMERPDYLLNKAILTQKIQKDGLDFPSEVVEYIARNVKDNVRDLEGVIVSLMAHSTFQNKEITLELAKKELSKCVLMAETKISIDNIQEVVCSQLKLERKLLFSKSRKREIVQARQIAMYLAKKHTEYSLSRIGEVLGRKDHATVLHACKTVKNQMDYDKSFSGLVNQIEQTLQTCN